jgi:hypothetical protein
LKKDIGSWRGGWIIINDGISTTPNKKISMILSFDFGAADHVFVEL